ncbi:hypothetical protein NIES267_28850 [Calothrix parasitica NIES-267]|uniref:HD domain-containing protein n=1 Tax=Calothrix parasitica NIES-267 TaxID=1973488 RepID=A0A1Z4LQA2_9CYAN|nr:hypothetical protein NIES267_28850 [Calothrix parasitica NIES-267]
MREQVLTYLSQNVPPERVNHILRVEQTAANLATVHGLDKQKAATAGIMHDDPLNALSPNGFCIWHEKKD